MVRASIYKFSRKFIKGPARGHELLEGLRFGPHSKALSEAQFRPLSGRLARLETKAETRAATAGHLNWGPLALVADAGASRPRASARLTPRKAVSLRFRKKPMISRVDRKIPVKSLFGHFVFGPKPEGSTLRPFYAVSRVRGRAAACLLSLSAICSASLSARWY